MQGEVWKPLGESSLPVAFAEPSESNVETGVRKGSGKVGEGMAGDYGKAGDSKGKADDGDGKASYGKGKDVKGKHTDGKGKSGR